MVLSVIENIVNNQNSKSGNDDSTENRCISARLKFGTRFHVGSALKNQTDFLIDPETSLITITLYLGNFSVDFITKLVRVRFKFTEDIMIFS